MARWSLAEVASKLVALGLVASIHGTTLWRWFQSECLKPWRFHLWQQVIDPLFSERARVVLWLYERAGALLKESIWVLCCDEKTSIQAREGIHAPKPAAAGHPAHVAARYKRRGALQLFAGLSVADGQVYGCCQARRRFVDFQAFLVEVIVPEALRRRVSEIRLILDHGPTHAPKQLQHWLDQQGWPLRIEVVWLPKYCSWLDQIEIWFSVLQRKLLTPNHFVSLEELRQRILAFIGHYNETAKPIQWSYTVAKLDAKFAMN